MKLDLAEVKDATKKEYAEYLELIRDFKIEFNDSHDKTSLDIEKANRYH